MGVVIPLLQGRDGEALVRAIRDGLAARGEVTQPLASLTVSPQRWRKAARTAARQLGRPVQTVATESHLHALLTDWPRDAKERAMTDAALRTAIEQIRDLDPG